MRDSQHTCSTCIPRLSSARERCPPPEPISFAIASGRRVVEMSFILDATKHHSADRRLSLKGLSSIRGMLNIEIVIRASMIPTQARLAMHVVKHVQQMSVLFVSFACKFLTAIMYIHQAWWDAFKVRFAKALLHFTPLEHHPFLHSALRSELVSFARPTR